MSTKDEIFNYVMHTPENTNPNILRQMLDESGGSSSGGIVHAVVDADDLFTEEGASFSLDMSMDEFLSGGYSAISLDLSSSGTVFQSFIVPLTIAFPSYNQVIFSGLCGVEGFYFVLAMLMDAGDGTVTGQALAQADAAIYFEPFDIICTPTAADISGTMDKTPAEIVAAYKAGRQIRVKVHTDTNTYTELTPSSIDAIVSDGEVTAVVVNCTFLHQDDGTYYTVLAQTSTQDSTYSTEMFIMTPAT